MGGTSRSRPRSSDSSIPEFAAPLKPKNVSRSRIGRKWFATITINRAVTLEKSANFADSFAAIPAAIKTRSLFCCAKTVCQGTAGQDFLSLQQIGRIAGQSQDSAAARGAAACEFAVDREPRFSAIRMTSLLSSRVCACWIAGETPAPDGGNCPQVPDKSTIDIKAACIGRFSESATGLRRPPFRQRNRIERRPHWMKCYRPICPLRFNRLRQCWQC